jgi:hypothetical protein
MISPGWKTRYGLPMNVAAAKKPIAFDPFSEDFDLADNGGEKPPALFPLPFRLRNSR